ncbi:hypothetical protein Aci011_019 [Acinetobacter phage vB_AbaM_B09_Aci01-1]|uniref:Uncharacterized protein n=1 Tax=Acinetobacter phage vB_AbaM_B09_Aci01-1 TaxID=2315466 RepID=A0A386KMI1_9CAUD|nr:hypothetical protein HOU29_gp162 [Acinetobacter phage vB_AbaM_B09_Aci01-1]AYD85683.1 hypothetical protein Aci011_019 [Acinetobacter phage vB_AbaM_B09_Aci01-1]
MPRIRARCMDQTVNLRLDGFDSHSGSQMNGMFFFPPFMEF